MVTNNSKALVAAMLLVVVAVVFVTVVAATLPGPSTAQPMITPTPILATFEYFTPMAVTPFVAYPPPDRTAPVRPTSTVTSLTLAEYRDWYVQRQRDRTDNQQIAVVRSEVVYPTDDMHRSGISKSDLERGDNPKMAVVLSGGPFPGSQYHYVFTVLDRTRGSISGIYSDDKDYLLSLMPSH